MFILDWVCEGGSGGGGGEALEGVHGLRLRGHVPLMSKGPPHKNEGGGHVTLMSLG